MSPCSSFKRKPLRVGSQDAINRQWQCPGSRVGSPISVWTVPEPTVCGRFDMGAVIIVVVLLSSIAGLWLAFDAYKRRRIERQLAAVLPAVATGPEPLSLRRAQIKTKWQVLHRLINYDPGIV